MSSQSDQLSSGLAKPQGSPVAAQQQQQGAVPEDPRIIARINKAIKQKRIFYSLEFFPPKTEDGVRNLYARMERMCQLEPMFLDVTWGAGGTTADLTLEISGNAQNYLPTEVMMHLTCTNMAKETIDEALEKAKKLGIRNILALRGDPPRGVETWEAIEGGFEHAVDLVRHIRKKYGDYFGIAVAGYPEGHLSCVSYEDDLKRLKEKVDAGADFIVTQLFYDVDVFIQYQQDCRKLGIDIPIVPGIMPIQAYGGFKRMTSFCKTKVPKEITDALEPIKDDDARVKAYGIELGIQMCKRLLEAGVPGLHFYTLNLERSVTQILAGLGFVTLQKKKTLPWKPKESVARRKDESVRPIFWANRPDSYLYRTNTWDEFPNGRWGDARSPAFGDLSDYHLVGFKTGPAAERKLIWGDAPTTLQDIYDVFENYLDGRIPRLPWCEQAVQPETVPIRDKLKRINKAGILTINSQPRINGVPSDDPKVGWGGPNGYIYQKAYIEFFCSPDLLKALMQRAPQYPLLTYHAVNVNGKTFTNLHDNISDAKEDLNIYDDDGKVIGQYEEKASTHSGVTAVTWGVFPNKEIIQPTVVDPASFLVWKDEAFALWRSQWLSLYKEGTASHKLLQSIHDTFFLVNIVDNDYIKGDIFAIFNDLLVAKPEA